VRATQREFGARTASHFATGPFKQRARTSRASVLLSVCCVAPPSSTSPSSRPSNWAAGRQPPLPRPLPRPCRLGPVPVARCPQRGRRARARAAPPPHRASHQEAGRSRSRRRPLYSRRTAAYAGPARPMRARGAEGRGAGARHRLGRPPPQRRHSRSRGRQARTPPSAAPPVAPRTRNWRRGGRARPCRAAGGAALAQGCSPPFKLQQGVRSAFLGVHAVHTCANFSPCLHLLHAPLLGRRCGRHGFKQGGVGVG
jgi:hypothetical protein